MKRILFVLLSMVFLVACNNGDGNADSIPLEKQTGLIVQKLERDTGNNQILLIPNVSETDIDYQDEEMLIQIAQEKDGAYYAVKDEEYDQLNLGDHVIVYWNGDQADSAPPQREATKIELDLDLE